MIYKCNNCLKEFNQKSNLNTHKRRKIPCIKHESLNVVVNETKEDLFINICHEDLNLQNVCPEFAIDDNEHKCLVCNKKFKHLCSLSKHKKKHDNYPKKNELGNIITEAINKINIDTNIKLNKIYENIEELKEENKKLKQENKKLQKDKIITNNSNNNTNSNNTVNNTINIIQFGKEDLEKLTKEEINKIIYTATGVDPLLTSIEVVHFNKRLPEQQNIKCNNINSKYVDIFNGKSWNKESMNSVIDDLADSHSYNLSELSKTADEKKLKSVVAKSCKVVDDSNKLYNNDLEYSDEDKVKVDKKNKKVRKAYAEKKEDIKKFIYNKTKEQITI